MSENTEAEGTGRRAAVAIDVAAPPDAVWSAVRDPTEVHRWFGWDYDGLDEEIQRIFVTDAVEGTDGDSRTLSWADGDVIAVAPGEAGAHLTISRRGDGGSDGRDAAPDLIDEGWIQFAQQLRYVLERPAEGRRRTVSVIDIDAGPVGAGPVYRLGVAASDGVPIGGHWEVSRDFGNGHDAVGGTIWYRSSYQAGYTVADPAGEALLVVQRVPAQSRPPHGRVSLVMSTYGLDDDAFTQVQRRWTAWWSGA